MYVHERSQARTSNAHEEGKERVGNFTRTEHSPDHVEGEHLYGSLVRVPLRVADVTLFMPTLQYDLHFNFSFFTKPKCQPKIPNASVQPSNVGDTSGVTQMNLPFSNTFGHYMQYNPNLELSLFGNM